MAISSTRIKFLDKENKILVKNFEDIDSNNIFSDIITPILSGEILEQFQGLQTLLDVQEGLSGLYRFITDMTVSNFSVKNIINGLDLMDPALAHLASTLTAIKSMSEEAVGVFMNTLLEVASDKLFDNPSLVNGYSTITNDTKVQIILASIDIFSIKLEQGSVSLSSITKEIKSTIKGVKDLSEASFTDVFNSIKDNKPTIDLNKVIAGTQVLPKDFYDEILEDEEPVPNSGSGGPATGPPAPGGGSMSGGVPQNGSNRFVDPYYDNLLVAYITIKRQYYRKYLVANVVSRNYPYEFYDILVGTEESVETEVFFNKTLSNSWISILHQNEAFLRYIGNCFGQMFFPANPGNTMALGSLKMFTNFICRLLKVALSHPFFVYLLDKHSGEYKHIDLSMSKFKNYITAPPAAFYLDNRDMVTFNAMNDAYETYKDVASKALVNHVKNVNPAKTFDNLSLPVIIAKYKCMLEVLQFIQGASTTSYYAGHALAMGISNQLGDFRGTSALTAIGMTEQDAILQEPSVPSLSQLIKNLSAAIKASPMVNPNPKESNENQAIITSLTSFSAKIDTYLYGDNSDTKIDSTLDSKELYDIMTETSYTPAPGDKPITGQNLDAEAYIALTVDIDRVTFSGDTVKII